MSGTNFSVASKIVGNAAVVSPKGYLNNLAGESLVRECSDFVERGIRQVVLNFSEIDFINSIGISFLLSVIEELNGCSGTLCFTNMKGIFSDTFEMLGLTKYILVFADEEDALRHLCKGSGEGSGP